MPDQSTPGESRNVDRYGAFVERFEIRGAEQGPLARLAFAASDLFDIAGHVTGAGNPDWRLGHAPAERHARVVQRLLDAGARLVGKTHTDELARGVLGENAHYGTPVNPRAGDCVPGGASSGAAVAVAASLCDFALGTDTGGSVRAPASFCGLYGIRPSYGRVSLDGVLPQAPSVDTVGWLARDPRTLLRVGGALLDPRHAVPVRPSRLIVPEDVFALADPTVASVVRDVVDAIAPRFQRVEHRNLSAARIAEWFRHQSALQSREAWHTFGGWIDRANPRLSWEVAMSFLHGQRVDDAAFSVATRFRNERRTELALRFRNGETVFAFPTMPFPAPPRGQPRSAVWSLGTRIVELTCVAGLLGAPQVTLPIGNVAGPPIGLSLLGAPGTDEVLLTLADELSS